MSTFYKDANFGEYRGIYELSNKNTTAPLDVAIQTCEGNTIYTVVARIRKNDDKRILYI